MREIIGQTERIAIINKIVIFKDLNMKSNLVSSLNSDNKNKRKK